MPVRFRCHGCQRVLSALDRKIGAAVNCPGCGTLLTVPTGDNVPTPPTVPSHPESALEVVDAMRESDRAGRQAHAGDGHGQILLSRRVLYAQAALIAVAAAAAFVGGYFVGRGNNAPQSSLDTVSESILVTGQVSIRTKTGESSPDADAAVLIVPAERSPRRDAKLDAAGLNPTSPLPAADDSVLATIEALGGAYARTNSSGEYRVALPQSGKYHVLVLSRGLLRGGHNIDRVDLATLGEYVFDALALIGQQEYTVISRELAEGDRVDQEFNE
jgi:hypothetical protein